jgi:hypothetical protein
LRFVSNRRLKRDKKSDVLSMNTSQKAKKLLADQLGRQQAATSSPGATRRQEDLNLEPSGLRFKS